MLIIICLKYFENALVSSVCRLMRDAPRRNAEGSEAIKMRSAPARCRQSQAGPECPKLCRVSPWVWPKLLTRNVLAEWRPRGPDGAPWSLPVWRRAVMTRVQCGLDGPRRSSTNCVFVGSDFLELEFYSGANSTGRALINAELLHALDKKYNVSINSGFIVTGNHATFLGQPVI